MNNLLQVVRKNFSSTKLLGDRTFSQLDFQELQWQPTSESNSIGTIVRHLHGNMVSRWTDFLTKDGEKEDRNRDSEFEWTYTSKEEIVKDWEAGWALVFATIDSLVEEDLEKTITIRGEVHTVVEALLRQVSHYSYHIGQIVYIGKEVKNENFQCLSIPKKVASTKIN